MTKTKLFIILNLTTKDVGLVPVTHNQWVLIVHSILDVLYILLQTV